MNYILRYTMERELTKGEYSVGLTFNPSGMESVNKIKQMEGAFNDYCYGFLDAMTVSPDDSPRRKWEIEQYRKNLELAIEHAQDASMRAIKALTQTIKSK